MKITDCGGCGNCADFKCPVDAFKFNTSHGFGSAEIDQEKCTDCKMCIDHINCLCEAIG